MTTIQSIIDNAGHHVTAINESTPHEHKLTLTTHFVGATPLTTNSGTTVILPPAFFGLPDNPKDTQRFAHTLTTGPHEPTMHQILTASEQLHNQLANARKARHAEYMTDCQNLLHTMLVLKDLPNYRAEWKTILTEAGVKWSHHTPYNTYQPTAILFRKSSALAHVRGTIPWSREAINIYPPHPH